MDREPPMKPRILVLEDDPVSRAFFVEVLGALPVAVDAVGAGVGETVFFVRGKEASFPFLPGEVPTDAGVVGLVDHWETVP